ncbi:MAG: cytochrome P450 [Chloroflexi bacterium]|nr:cytochrome P450 [Chloroflexota bacterium]MCC6896852.1 cytochrome P450 [Anaerolineae bacterium]
MVTLEVEKQPAGTSGFPIIGSMAEFARDPIKFVTRLQRDYGDVAAFSLMGSKSVLVSDPQAVDRILVETGKRYDHGKRNPSLAMQKILGNGLVTSEGDFWKRQRKLIAPAFHHQSIKKYADQIVEYTQDLAKTWQPGTTRDLHQDMMSLTQRIIMKVLFDVDVQGTVIGDVTGSFDAMMHALGAEQTGIEAILPDFIPTPSRRQMQEAVTHVNGLLLELIEQRRKEGSEQRDLLTMFMETRDEDGQPMSDEQLLDEIRTLYLAGHETTATTLSWAWMLLSQNPEAYAQVEAEVDRVLNGRTPTSDDVPQLAYCNAVIKESLRCYPVAWITRRVPLEDVEINGYHIAGGTFVFLSPWVLHHDSRWFEKPDAFMPERWLKDKAEQPLREAYIPFGGGPRVCIGNGFAMMESVLILAALAQKHHVALLPEHRVELEIAGTLRPKSGLEATLTARSL